MDEKAMVSDVLTGVKSSLITYQRIITETEDMELRQIMQQIRNSDESFHYELYKIAQVKGYCESQEYANNVEIQNTKIELQ